MIEVPGETPKSPLMTVGPVFVTPEAPRTAKTAAVPRLMAWALMVTKVSPKSSRERSVISSGSKGYKITSGRGIIAMPMNRYPSYKGLPKLWG